MADVLVAGGSGFIGSHLVKRLVDRGDHVTILSLNSKPLPKYDSRQIERITVDLRNNASVKNGLSERLFDNVFNLSGFINHMPILKGGRSVLDQHFLAVQNLIENLNRSRLKSFVQIGSSDEYGNAPAPQSEELRESPIAPYSLGKVAATHFIQMLNKTENFPGVVIRFFLVYGPGQDDRRFIPQIIKGCLANQSFAASDGKQLRDFCYVDDIVDGLIKASTISAAHGHVINLASGIPTAVRTVVENIAALCKGGKPQYGQIPYRTGENMGLYASIEKAKTMLGWEPQINLSAGLQKTIESFRPHTPLDPQ